MPELQDLEVLEVSLVDRPANRRKYLLIKNRGEAIVDELLALILETQLEDEAAVDAALEGVPESAHDALKGALKLFNAHREEVDAATFKSFFVKCGFLEEEDGSDGDGKTDDKVGLVKDDGTLNLEDVPEAMRESIEALWKEKAAAEEKATELSEEITKREEEAEAEMFVAKAESLTLPAKADELGPVLRSISKACPEEFKYLEDLLKKASAIVAKSDLLEEVGAIGTDVTGTWEERAEALVKAKVLKSEGKLSRERALDEVMKEHPEIAQDYLKEN